MIQLSPDVCSAIGGGTEDVHVTVQVSHWIYGRPMFFPSSSWRLDRTLYSVYSIVGPHVYVETTEFSWHYCPLLSVWYIISVKEYSSYLHRLGTKPVIWMPLFQQIGFFSGGPQRYFLFPVNYKVNFGFWRYAPLDAKNRA